MSVLAGEGRTVIINGGDPLPGCPKSFDEAHAWADSANGELAAMFARSASEGEMSQMDAPSWSFDCGFKLDFDGPVCDVSSRFYPPKSHYGPTWDGTVSVRVFGVDIAGREFDAPTLEALRTQVECYVESIGDTVRAALLKEHGEVE